MGCDPWSHLAQPAFASLVPLRTHSSCRLARGAPRTPVPRASADGAQLGPVGADPPCGKLWSRRAIVVSSAAVAAAAAAAAGGGRPGVVASAVGKGCVGGPKTEWADVSTAPSMYAHTVAEASLRKYSMLYERASGSLLPVSALPHILGRQSRPAKRFALDAGERHAEHAEDVGGNISSGDTSGVSRAWERTVSNGTIRDDKRCILLGEVHDEVECHAAQLATLQTLHSLEKAKPLVVAFEQFYRQHTPVLQDYTNGKIDLDQMLTRTSWSQTWGFDPALYIPIFRFCRSNRIPMVGMNVPSKVVHLTSRVGLAGLPEAVRAALPSVDTSNAEHREHFFSAMGFGADVQSDLKLDVRARIDRFYQSQCLWDDYMAESLSAVLGARADARVVALVGSGHIDTRTAIPDRVQQRSGVRPFSIVTRPVAWAAAVAGVPMPQIEAPERGADVVWYTRRRQDLI